jgi:hypothetical protein
MYGGVGVAVFGALIITMGIILILWGIFKK